GSDARRVRVEVLLADGSGTAWFDDLSLSRLFAPRAIDVHGTTTTVGSTVRERPTLGGHGLALSATFRPTANHVAVSGSLMGTNGADHAAEVTFTVPIHATGWSWADDARHSRTIAAGRTYASLSTTSVQRTSRYPFGVVFGRSAALAIAVPMSQPRMFRIAYDSGRGFSVSFD